MTVLEHHGHVEGHDDWPGMTLQVRLLFDEEPPGDAKAIRHEVLQRIKAYLRRLEMEDWDAHTTLLDRHAPPEAAREGPYHMPASRRPKRPKLKPNEVELPEATKRACHRLVDAVFLLGVHGRAVSTGDVIKSRKVSQTTVYKLLDQSGGPWRYLEPYLAIRQSKHRRFLDLTDEGRKLASLIRAGEIPA